MKSAIFTFILLCLLSLSVFAQGETNKTEAYKVDEFGAMVDCDLNNRIFLYAEEVKKIPKSKAVFLIYRGITQKTVSYYSQLNLLKRNIDIFQKDKDRVITQHVGLREKYTVEFWIVPEGAEIPKPTNIAEKVDELGKTLDEDVWVRLENFLENVKESGKKGYVINFGKKSDKVIRLKQIMKGISRYILDSSLFEIIDSGYSKELKTEFWILKK